ncbi:malic enzyme [Arenicella chitinivorans]|uniref:NADP-dependent malic enzyme n=2 Tax=Arenicella chitinivorans TaxID=1329800 RepID=A0A918VIS9_9GAMM|nr:malic enzyme [Arenicella chitinivorans]
MSACIDFNTLQRNRLSSKNEIMTTSSDNLRDAALHYHRTPSAGKIRVQATKPLSNQRDLALAYSPGVAEPCKEIEKNPLAAADYTSRSNLVGVVTNGTAVLGLGNIGALASKPVMEGKAILFKNFADVNAYDIEVNETDVDAFCDIVAALEPTFGGINLEDIKAPQCFEIEEKLRERMNIPVFHDDQHGTAIVSAAAVINGLKVVGKHIEDVKLVVSGAGAAAMACTNLLLDLGVDINNVLMLDSRGVIHSERENLDATKQKFARATTARTLEDAMLNCDVFLGVSQPNLVSVDMLKSMADKPLILAMSNPDPEVRPELVYEHRPDAVMATGRSDYPNQVNNVLCFPFLFRGALDVGATTINQAMKIACVNALAELAHSESNEIVASYYQNESMLFGAGYILPKPFDPRLITTIAPAVAQAAIDSGVATRPFEDIETYRASLEPLVYRTGNVMRPIFEKAQNITHKVLYTDGENERVLRAVQDVVDQSYARPVLLGDVQTIHTNIEKLGLRLQLNRDYEVIAPRGTTEEDRVKYACVLIENGTAHAALTGPGAKLHEQIGAIERCIGTTTGDDHMAVMHLLLLDTGTVFIADTSIHENPSAEELANITVLAAQEVRRFGMTPRVALLSHSSFGSHVTESSKKMARTKQLLAELAPELEVDGEMKGATALNATTREKSGKSTLSDNANLLIMPNLDAANITYTVLKSMANGISVGPILLGTDLPIHPITKTTTPRGIVNLTSLVTASVK